MRCESLTITVYGSTAELIDAYAEAYDMDESEIIERLVPYLEEIDSVSNKYKKLATERGFCFKGYSA